ncbi:MAG: hypothetical protein JOZ57_00160, partial [Abitibacteriaceae bacterium]|nr:hypothetical protein [Abditibacteriaceae bacterium]
MKLSKPIFLGGCLGMMAILSGGSRVISLMSPVSPHYVALHMAVPGAAPAAAQDAPAGTQGATDMELAHKAFAVLQTYCIKCHGNGKRMNRQAAIDQDTWARLVQQQRKVVPGRPQQSTLHLSMVDQDNPMPPRQVRPRPTTEEIDVVRQWIASGAPNWATVEASNAGPNQVPGQAAQEGPRPQIGAAPAAPAPAASLPAAPAPAATGPAAPPATASLPAQAAPAQSGPAQPATAQPAAAQPSVTAPDASVPGTTPATAPAAATGEIAAGEIMIEGTVQTVAADGSNLTLQASRFTLPNKRSHAIQPMKKKTVLLVANTAL